MIALWTQEPPYRLQGKRWRLTTERTWMPDLGQGGDAQALPEALPADRDHGDPAELERHRRRRGARLDADIGQLRASLGGEDA